MENDFVLATTSNQEKIFISSEAETRQVDSPLLRVEG
jgi:hypothetical protein